MIAAASALLLAQTPAQPFPHHETPPDGWHCVPARNAKELSTNPHACSCLGMVLEPMCGKTPEETIARQESNKCKVWCHRDACACAKTCGDT